MANEHLRRSPQRRREGDDWWWYEEPKGITVVVAGQCYKISWTRLRYALARKEKRGKKRFVNGSRP